MRIVVADDDPEILRIVAKGLWAAGFEPLVAADALQVMVFAHQYKPSAILLDINMPAGSGLGALKLLKMSRKTKPIPVIVMSATADEGAPDAARALGAVEFFHKPLDMNALLAKVRQVTGAAAPGESEAGKATAAKSANLYVVPKKTSVA